MSWLGGEETRICDPSPLLFYNTKIDVWYPSCVNQKMTAWSKIKCLISTHNCYHKLKTDKRIKDNIQQWDKKINPICSMLCSPSNGASLTIKFNRQSYYKQNSRKFHPILNSVHNYSGRFLPISNYAKAYNFFLKNILINKFSTNL